MLGCCEFLTALVLFFLAPFVALSSVLFPILAAFVTIYALDKLFLRKDAKCNKRKEDEELRASSKEGVASKPLSDYGRKVSDYGTASEKGVSDTEDEDCRKTKNNQDENTSLPPECPSGLNDLERGRSRNSGSSSSSNEENVEIDDVAEVPQLKRTRSSMGSVKNCSVGSRTIVFKEKISEKKNTEKEEPSEDNKCCSLKSLKVTTKSKRVRGFTALFFAFAIVTTIFYNGFKTQIVEAENPADVQPGKNIDYFFLRFFFGKFRSRVFGHCSEIRLPECLREPVLSVIFGRIYNADMDAAEKPVREYGSMQEYFMRGVKEGTFTVQKEAALVSPVQGTVVALGDITKPNMRVKQVKQTEYSVKSFLGQEPFSSTDRRTKYCVLYLAPGDYHRFHSPAGSFEVHEGRHFAGEVLPVSTKLISQLGLHDLFSVNERVVLSGSYGEERSSFWPGSESKKKQMHYAAVAAYNVGGIWMDFDKTLRTNDPEKNELFYTSQKSYGFLEGSQRKVTFEKGDLVGGFAFGSTIVMVFDTDEGDEWAVKEGDRIHMGEPLLVNRPETISA